jgi:hypothetical protein
MTTISPENQRHDSEHRIRDHGSGTVSDLCSDAERIEWACPSLPETARTDEIRCPRHLRLLPKMDSQQTYLEFHRGPLSLVQKPGATIATRSIFAFYKRGWFIHEQRTIVCNDDATLLYAHLFHPGLAYGTGRLWVCNRELGAGA